MGIVNIYVTIFGILSFFSFPIVMSYVFCKCFQLYLNIIANFVLIFLKLDLLHISFKYLFVFWVVFVCFLSNFCLNFWVTFLSFESSICENKYLEITVIELFFRNLNVSIVINQFWMSKVWQLGSPNYEYFQRNLVLWSNCCSWINLNICNRNICFIEKKKSLQNVNSNMRRCRWTLSQCTVVDGHCQKGSVAVE